MRDDPLLGRVLGGKYELYARIGKGATGQVYRARQLSLDRDVAVKVLRPGCAHRSEIVARFRLEARAASRLAHPGIITVFDWGEEPDGLLYLVLEHLLGIDLFDLAHAEGSLSSRRIARLMLQVARALAHAHARGVVHRDLKPENLRIVDGDSTAPEEDEIVKIYDFGTAFVAGLRAPGVTEAGMVVGTPDYMSPEQASARRVVPGSDLYACGVIMFFLATGRLPFTGKTALDLALAHLSIAPPFASSLRPDIDPRLDRVIVRCLQKRPTDRPASARELAAMLEPIATSPPTRAPAAQDRAPHAPPPRNPRQKYAAIGVLGAALAIGLALATLGWTPGRDAAVPAAHAPASGSAR